jgi:hypothetical protein
MSARLQGRRNEASGVADLSIRAEFQTDHEHYAIVEKFGEAAEIAAGLARAT